MSSRGMTRRSFVAASATALGALALAGCAGGTQQDAAPASDAAPSEDQASSSAAADTQATSSAAETPAATETPTEEATEAAAGATMLVACFSATGNTRGVAEHLANHLGADYLEIEPAEPYTEADLNYDDETTRATAEQNDPSARPALASMPDFSAYDTVLLGHPIWWSKAPRLICMLLEGSDLSGKKVAEFCTSGSSGIKGAASELAELAPNAEWIGARRFASGATEAEVAEWTTSLGLS